jgi:hypothetical protein
MIEDTDFITIKEAHELKRKKRQEEREKELLLIARSSTNKLLALLEKIASTLVKNPFLAALLAVISIASAVFIGIAINVGTAFACHWLNCPK